MHNTPIFSHRRVESTDEITLLKKDVLMKIVLNLLFYFFILNYVFLRTYMESIWS